MRRRLASVVALLAFAGLVDSAQAERTAETARTWTTADIRTATRIADAHWPTSPCGGREVVQWVDEETLRIDQHDTESTFGAEAFYFDGSCLVRVARDFLVANNPTPDYLCAVLMHEFGHLAGLGHSERNRDVMRPDIVDDEWVPWACARAFPARRMCRYIPSGYSWITVRRAVGDYCLD